MIIIDKKKEISPTQLLKLYEAVGWNSLKNRTIEKNKKMLSATSYACGIYEKKELIAFGRVISDSYTAQILDVIVAPNFRRKGLASKIMEKLVSFIKSEGLIGATLVDGSGYETFYQKFGFFGVDTKSDRLMYFKVDFDESL